MTSVRLSGSGSTKVSRKLRFAVLAAAALALAGCQDALDLDDGLKAERPLPAKVKQTLQAKGMASRSPVMMRIFKEEGVLEVWKQKDTGRFDLVKTYQICKWSGGLGPKIKEGDRQAPEGFYHVGNGQMNPNSSYYLSFNLGFPNSYDRSHGRTGTNLMVHGACSSAGCYSMTDEQVAEIYAFAREALRGGQKYFQVQAFPFRMTAQNMARHRGSPHFAFWEMLKEGYDHFELTKIPPDVDVCGKRYVFNRTPQGGSFQASAACPPMSMPESLSVAYAAHQQTFKQAFDLEVAKLDKAEADKKAAAEAKAAEEEAARLAAEAQAKAEADAKAAAEAAAQQPADAAPAAEPLPQPDASVPVAAIPQAKDAQPGPAETPAPAAPPANPQTAEAPQPGAAQAAEAPPAELANQPQPEKSSRIGSFLKKINPF